MIFFLYRWSLDSKTDMEEFGFNKTRSLTEFLFALEIQFNY